MFLLPLAVDQDETAEIDREMRRRGDVEPPYVRFHFWVLILFIFSMGRTVKNGQAYIRSYVLGLQSLIAPIWGCRNKDCFFFFFFFCQYIFYENQRKKTTPNDDDGQDHMFRFIPLKEVDRSATLIFGEVATPKVFHDHDDVLVDRQKHACSFCALCAPKCHRDFHAVIISVDFELDVVLLTQTPYNRFQHSNLEQGSKDVQIFKVSGDSVSK